jgi:hypothetical protein
MASNVSNAIGTQRQFSGVPQDTYAKRLIQSDSSSQAAAATRGVGMQLAQSLGVLGEAIGTLGFQQEKDKEKIGIAKAEEIAAGQTEENWRKLSAIDMISASGAVDTADNPYAISMIERMRGKFLSSRARLSYETEVIQKEGHSKTADEEVSRYNKYMQEHFGTSSGASSDLEAFQKGFWDNHAVDQVGVADKQIKWSSQQMDAIRQGETSATLRIGSEKWGNTPKEDLAASWNSIMADNRIANASIPERIQQIKGAAQDFVQSTGDHEKLTYILDNVTIGVDGSGKEIKASSVISPEDFRQEATIRTRQIFGERLQGDLKKLSGMSVPEMNKWFEDTQRDDPKWFGTVVDYRPGLVNQRTKLEEDQKREALKLSITQHVRKQSFGVLDSQLKAYLNGNTHDAQGFLKATSFSGLPTLEYDVPDEKGGTTSKKHSWKKEDVFSFIDHHIQTIKADGSLTDEEKSAQVLQVLQWGPAENYRDSVKSSLGMALDTLTVDKLKTDGQGKANLTPQMQDALRMYQTDPEASLTILGEKNISDLDHLQLLLQAEGDERAAVSQFAQVRDKRKDKDAVKAASGQVQHYLSTATVTGFRDISGKELSVNTSIMSNYSLMKRIKVLAEDRVLGGMAPDKAVEVAKEKVRANTYIYKDTAIPRSIFNGIDSEHRITVGQQVLDYYVQDFANQTGLDSKFIATEWDIDRNVFVVSGGGGHVRYTLNDIAYSGNYLLQENSKNPGGRNIELLEAQEANAMRRPITPPVSDELNIAGWDPNVTQANRGDRP